MAVWESPDARIRKEVVRAGEPGPKPYENTSCKIRIYNCVGVVDCGLRDVVVGESDSEFERLLDKCLLTMHRNEEANVVFKTGAAVCFTLHLLDYQPKGFIYEWDAARKYQLASHHKARGNELFRDRHVDASHRFGKALKILCSIPIGVERPPELVDGVKVSDIQLLKVALYNNLASCYLKSGSNEAVIRLCGKVLSCAPGNVKALYKSGVAWCGEGDYGKGREFLRRVLDLEPDNKAAREKLCFATVKLQEAQARVDSIVKKMFEV